MVAKAYSRLPLLLSPSTTFCPVAELVRVEPDARSDADDVSTDGQAELGIEAARALGLLAPGTVPDRCPAWQFRAVLPVEDRGLCLAKGMLMVNPDLGGKLALRPIRRLRKFKIWARPWTFLKLNNGSGEVIAIV